MLNPWFPNPPPNPSYAPIRPPIPKFIIFALNVIKNNYGYFQAFTLSHLSFIHLLTLKIKLWFKIRYGDYYYPYYSYYPYCAYYPPNPPSPPSPPSPPPEWIRNIKKYPTTSCQETVGSLLGLTSFTS